MRSKTILMLLTNAYDPDPRVRQEALTLVAMGCSVRLLAWDRDLKSPAAETMEGVEVDRVRLASRHGRGTSQIFFYLALYLRLLWRGWRTRFDVVHCHDLDTLPLGFVLGKLKQKPVVYDSHESFMDMLEGSVHPAVRAAILRLENYLIRRVDVLITVGEKLRRAFEARGARRTAVVGNWKALEDYERTDEQNAAVRKRLGVPQGAILISCITQLLKNRMIEELVEAAADFPNVYILLAGKGALETQVRQWAAENPRVLFPGFVHASEVPAYTCASDVIYCGFDPENPNAAYAAPNKLFEALAAGRPLISPDVGEIGDIIRRGNCGVVTPDCTVASVREAVRAMCNDESRREWTHAAQQIGRLEMNWRLGREVLYREYSRFIPDLTRNAQGAGARRPATAAAPGRP
jgi:glycosyltransferase involved in cell wall biosynthesis